MATPTLHDRILTDLASLVTGLGLQGQAGVIGPPQTFVEEQDAQLQVPCVLVSARGLQEQEDESSFEQDYVTYPALLMVCDTPRPTYAQVGPVLKGWRHAIAQKL